MSTNKFSAAASGFKRRLAENSPLEGPVKGFNRFARDMSPATRELVLKARMPEIMAFAEDRRIDPAVVAGVVEASMRLGRIPDLGLYGLAGDEALAVKDFVATAMLGLEYELNQGLPVLSEDADKAARHKSYANHYRALAQKHAQAMEFHTDAAKEANRAGRPFTAAQHQGKIAMLKQLHLSHGSLADFHDCESTRHQKAAARAVPTGAGPTNPDQPTGQPMRSAHPAQGSTAAQRPEVPVQQRQEQTTSSSLAPIMKPIGSGGAFLRRGALNLVSSRKPRPDEEDENKVEQVRSKSANGFFQRTTMIEEMLAEAKKDDKKDDKKKSKVPDKKELGIKSDPEKADQALANAKMAALFQTLGHKMDHACAKLKGHKVKDEWAKKLNKACLSKGGPAAYHEVVKESLTEPWIRDQGFVDEAAQLNHLWQTTMSVASEPQVTKAAVNSPEPLVFTINRMIDMAKGRGSVF
ncbi:MAG: hypothetical protein AB7L09_00205 [Nitrospira sp.]